jgi:hypothetical protein
MKSKIELFKLENEEKLIIPLLPAKVKLVVMAVLKVLH